MKFLVLLAILGALIFILASNLVTSKGFFGSLFPKPPSFAAGETVITIKPNEILHPASSYVLGTNRNHTPTSWEFPNAQAKLLKMQELTPNWAQGKYLYRYGGGPVDGRVDYSYMTGFHFEQKWGTKTSYPYETNPVYPYDDIRNYLYEANTMGSDQIHTVNFGTGTPEEAGRYVSYLNKAGDTNRTTHPYSQQNTELFELGNEISWRMERGHDQFAPNETAYATRAKQFSQQMRANSDVPIQIGAVATTNSNWLGDGWSGNATTIRNILQTMGSDVDFLIFHGYPSWPLYTNGEGDLQKLQVMAQNEWNKNKLETVIKPAIKQYANGRDIWLANTESYAAYDDKFSRGMFGAMYNADSIITAMKEDIRVVIEFCFSHGIIRDSRFFYGNDPEKTTPIFLWQKMLSKHWGDEIVTTSDSNIPTVLVDATEDVNLPKLSHTAAVKGNKVFLLVLNRVNDSDVVSSIDPGFHPSKVTAYELAGNKGWDSTTYNCDSSEGNCQISSDDVSIKAVNNPSLTNYNFKKASITIFELEGFNEVSNSNCEANSLGLSNSDISVMWQKINETRQAAGLAPLIWSNTLAKSASWMAEDSANKSDAPDPVFPSQIDSLGRTPRERLTDCGYNSGAIVGTSVLKVTTDVPLGAYTTWSTYDNLQFYRLVHNIGANYTTGGLGFYYSPNNYYPYFWVLDVGTVTENDVTPTPSPTSAPSAPPTSFVPGDINRNGRVDIFDFNLLITDFGKTDTTSLRSDINRNGRVDIFDFNLLITNFGRSG